MALKRVVRLDTGNVAAGSFVDLTYAPEVTMRLKRMVVVETTAGAYSLLFLTFYLGDNPIFRPEVSAALFAPNVPVPVVFDLEHKEGVKLSMRVTNADTATRRLLVHLIYEE